MERFAIHGKVGWEREKERDFSFSERESEDLHLSLNCHAPLHRARGDRAHECGCADFRTKTRIGAFLSQDELAPPAATFTQIIAESVAAARFFSRGDGRKCRGNALRGG